MIHLIPHPTEILKLVSFQKKIISSLQTDDFIFIQSIPLWIPLNENYKDIKETSQKIKQVTIFPPELNFEEKKILSPVEITFEDSSIISKLNLSDIYIRNKNDSKTTIFEESAIFLKKMCTENNLFPCTLKIFRIASIQESSETSKTIESFQWKKLKNS